MIFLSIREFNKHKNEFNNYMICKLDWIDLCIVMNKAEFEDLKNKNNSVGWDTIEDCIEGGHNSFKKVSSIWLDRRIKNYENSYISRNGVKIT